MIVDLTMGLNEETPVYPGDPQLGIEAAATFETSGYLGHSVSLSTHAGTHIDAPAHMISSGRTLGTFPAESFVGRGRCISAEGGAFDLESVRKAGIEAGDIVVFYTGMGARASEPAYLRDYPAMANEIAEYLAACRVKMVGVDTCSIDNSADFPNHRTLLGQDILIIENLTNLEKILGTEPMLYALPLRLDLDAAPARVIAEVS